MIRFFKRIVCLCLCAVLLLPLAACGEVGSGHVDTTTVLKVGDYKITMDEYLYLCYKYRYAYDKGDATYWDTHPEAEAKLYMDVLDELCAIYAVFALAQEYDVKLDKADKAELDAIISSYIEPYGSEEAYLAAARESHMTGDLVRREETVTMLQEKLFATLSEYHLDVLRSDDAYVEAAIANNEFFCVRYIMVQNIQDNAAARAKNRAVAEKWRAQVANGLSMQRAYTLALSEMADLPEPDLLNPTYGLLCGNDMTRGTYLVRGYLDAKEEEQVLALGVGGVTEVVESESYFCFYERVACDDAYMQGQGFGSLRDLLLQKQFSDLCAEKAKELRQDIKYRRAYEGAFSVRTA